jgi:hypothetical protein
MTSASRQDRGAAVRGSQTDRAVALFKTASCTTAAPYAVLRANGGSISNTGFRAFGIE